MKAITEIKLDTEQTMKLIHSVRASERNSVVVGSNPTQVSWWM